MAIRNGYTVLQLLHWLFDKYDVVSDNDLHTKQQPRHPFHSSMQWRRQGGGRRGPAPPSIPSIHPINRIVSSRRKHYYIGFPSCDPIQSQSPVPCSRRPLGRPRPAQRWRRPQSRGLCHTKSDRFSSASADSLWAGLTTIFLSGRGAVCHFHCPLNLEE
jgi:hypothetical protein